MTPRPSALATLLLRAAQVMSTPLLPDDFIALVNPLAAGDALRGRLISRQLEAVETATITIRPSRGWRPHRPGQYVRLGVDVNGVRHWRAYSITSPPDRADGTISVTVRAADNGLVSEHLVRHARLGSIVMLDVAAGEFVMPERLPTSVLFLTAGSGITPIMGMLRAHSFGDVVVIHSDRTADDVIFGAELRQLAADGRIRLHEQHTATSGRVDLTRLDQLVPDYRDRDTWACGPHQFLADAVAAWAAAGIPERLHTEAFSKPTAEAGEGGLVTCSRSKRQIEVDGTTAILDAAEANGLLLKSGCRMGICYTCVVPLTEGSVRDVRTGKVTSPADGERVFIQTCVSAAAGPCSIDC